MVLCVSLLATALRTSATIYQDVLVSGIFIIAALISIVVIYSWIKTNSVTAWCFIDPSDFLCFFVCCFRLSLEFLAHLETSSLPLKACKFRLTLMFIKQWWFSFLDTPCATWGTLVALTFMKVVEHLSVELY